MPWYFKVFIALGGVGLVWKIAGSNARSLVHSGLGFVFHKFPAFAEFVRANKDRINPILQDAEKGVEDAENDIPAAPPVIPCPPAAEANVAGAAPIDPPKAA